MNHFEWQEFYDVGNHLKNYSKEESYQRSAIGRYYYACYQPVKDYYQKSFRTTIPSTKDSHRTLINLLKNSPFIEEQRLGKTLENLRNNRNYADYTSKQLGNLITSESKKYAEEIFLMLKKLYANPLRLMKN